MNNCMNCGAMLMSGATVCPVCQQPTTQAPGNPGWQQPPVNPQGTPWQPPGSQFAIGPPPLGSSKGPNTALVLVSVVAIVLLFAGVMGAIFFFQMRRSSRVENDNYNRTRSSPTPYVYTPPPTAPTAPSGRPGSTISGGVLNGKAIELPQPVYPQVAKAAHASGTVVVQVTVDESGKVINARAVSGHPLLQAAATQAAQQARFSPTLLSGKPVKVTGVLTYNFARE